MKLRALAWDNFNIDARIRGPRSMRVIATTDLI